MKKKGKFIKRRLQCDFCVKNYRSNFAYQLHLNVHQSCQNSWFQCQRCGKKFSKIIRLVKHRVIHPPRKKRDERKSLLLRKKKSVEAACRRIQKLTEKLHDGSIVCQAEKTAHVESIQFATEAEDVKVADLPSSQPHFHRSKDYCSTSKLYVDGNFFSRFGIVDPITNSCTSTNAPDEIDCAIDISSENSVNTNRFDHKKKNSNECQVSDDLQVSVVSSSNLNSKPLPAVSSSTNEAETFAFACGVCEKQFQKKSNWVKHSQYCFQKRPKCIVCKKVLATYKSLKAHMNTHNCGVKYPCPSCGKKYAWKYSLTKHMKSDPCCNSNTVLSIEEVNKTEKIFDVRDSTNVSPSTGGKESADGNLQKYLSRSSTSKLVSKSNSGSKRSHGSKAKFKAVNSIDGNQDGFMYPCIDCSEPFRTEDQMWNHFEAVHCVMDQSPRPSFVKPISDSSLKGSSLKNPSPKNFVHKNPKQCNICGRVFTSAHTANAHLATHTGVKNFSCSVCNKKFAWRCSLSKHLRRTSCGVIAGEDVVLQNQISPELSNARMTSKKTPTTPISAFEGMGKDSIHSDDSSKSDIHDTVATVRREKQNGRGNLNRIVVREAENSKGHSDSLEKHLEVTKQKLARSRRLISTNKHLVLAENFIRNSILIQEGYGVPKNMVGLLDLGDGPEMGQHKCQLCDKTYKYKSSLRIHHREHTGERPYQCNICKERFAVQRFCRKHVIKHGEESEDPQLQAAFKKIARIGKEAVNKEAAAKIENSVGEAGVAEAKEKMELCSPLVSHKEENIVAVVPCSSKTSQSTNGKEILGQRDLPVREARNKRLSYIDIDDTSDEETGSRSQKRTSTKKIVRDSLKMRKSSDCESESSSEEMESSAKRRRRSSHVLSFSDKDASDNDWCPSFFPDQEESDIQEEFDGSCASSTSKISWTDVKWRSPLKKDEDGDGSKGKSKLLFQCKVCDTKFASRFVLRRHEVITGHAKASYECPYCKRIYSEGGAYSNHMYVHQRENGMKCDICGKELQSRTTFLNHKEMHRKNPFTCNLCFEWFPSEAKLQSHANTSHDQQKEFKCKYCHKTFDWQSNYTRHMNKHTNKKEFKCKICHYSFNIISNLKRHMISVHKGETEFGASTWEAVNPAQVDHVLNRQHQRRDLWKVEEGTDEDDGAMKRRGRLKALKAVNKKKYPCEICQFVCSSRMELTNHLRYWHKEGNNPKAALIHFVVEDENFVCQLCGSVIYIRHSLKNHMLRVHQLDVTEDDIAGVSKESGSLKKENGFTERKRSKKAPKPTLTNVKKNEDREESFEAELSLEKKRGKSSGASDLSFDAKKSNRAKVYPNDREKEAKALQRTEEKEKKQKVAKVNQCSLCSAKFTSKEQLVEHLRKFHKVPAGFEEALIDMTVGVNSRSVDAGQSNDHKD